MARFCPNCGNQVDPKAVICVKCGCALPQTGYNSYGNSYHNPGVTAPSVVTTISQRLKTNSIIWIVIAAIQLLLGLCGAWGCLIIGALNLISAIQDIKYSKSILQQPTGIVDRVKPLAGAVITLIYNLLIGGIVGVVGSIYYFVAVRGYVMENQEVFLSIEAQTNAGTCPIQS